MLTPIVLDAEDRALLTLIAPFFDHATSHDGLIPETLSGASPLTDSRRLALCRRIEMVKRTLTELETKLST